MLAVIGCHPVRAWTQADVGELGWTSVDAPLTVLKTAGLASTDVRRRAPNFGRQRPQPVVVRLRPQLCAGMAVFSAVNEAK